MGFLFGGRRGGQRSAAGEPAKECLEDRGRGTLVTTVRPEAATSGRKGVKRLHASSNLAFLWSGLRLGVSGQGAATVDHLDELGEVTGSNGLMGLQSHPRQQQEGWCRDLVPYGVPFFGGDVPRDKPPALVAFPPSRKDFRSDLSSGAMSGPPWLSRTAGYDGPCGLTGVD